MCVNTWNTGGTTLPSCECILQKPDRFITVYLTHDRFLATCVKFSIASSVDLKSSNLARLVRLGGNHLSLVNDLASFDKEFADLKSGNTASIINIVDVLQRSCSLDDVSDAKAAAYTLQLLTEDQIKHEIGTLMAGDKLSSEEWRFVDALIAMLSSHVFFCMTCSRYGGEASRIRRN